MTSNKFRSAVSESVRKLYVATLEASTKKFPEMEILEPRANEIGLWVRYAMTDETRSFVRGSQRAAMCYA